MISIFFQGFDTAEGGGIDLISHIIKRILNIEVNVLMGANLAGEVAEEKFCETTIGTPLCFIFCKTDFILMSILTYICSYVKGCKDRVLAPMLKDLIETDNFKVSVVDDVDTVEICGALKVFENA